MQSIGSLIMVISMAVSLIGYCIKVLKNEEY